VGSEEDAMSTLFADGFEDAFIGLGAHFNRIVAVYDYDKCIEVLRVRDGMTREEAIEFFQYNVLDAWMGEHTPVFLHFQWPQSVRLAKTIVEALEDYCDD